jgi:hypothetical protein
MNKRTLTIPSAHIQMVVWNSGNPTQSTGLWTTGFKLFKSSTITYVEQTDSKAQHKINNSLIGT